MDSYSNSSVNFTFTDRTLQSNTRNAYTCRQFWKINIRNNSRFITKEGYTEKQIQVSLFCANYSLKYCFANSWKSLPFAGSTGFLFSGSGICMLETSHEYEKRSLAPSNGSDSFLRMLYAILDSFPCRIPFPLSLQMRSPAMLSCRA